MVSSAAHDAVEPHRPQVRWHWLLARWHLAPSFFGLGQYSGSWQFPFRAWLLQRSADPVPAWGVRL